MKELKQALTRIVLVLYFGDQSKKDAQAAGLLISEMIGDAVEGEPQGVRERLRKQVSSLPRGVISRAPPGIQAWLDDAILRPALLRWAHDVAGTARASPEDFEQRVFDWFKDLSDESQAKVLGAAIRHAIGQQADSDEERRREFEQALFPTKENSMATHKYAFDSRGLPDSLKANAAQKDWETSVEKQIANLGLVKNDTDEVSSATYAVMKGMLLLDEVFDVTNAAFPQAVQQVWLETLGTVPAVVNGTLTTMNDRNAYVLIADQMQTSSPQGAIIYQQLASVARYVVANGQEVPVASALFPSQVRIGMDGYVSGPPPAETLDIPPLTGPSGPEGELDQQNMLAFSTVYAIKNLDEMGVYKAVDWQVEDFLNGLLASGHDSVGRKLDAWFWRRRDRMTEADRFAVFSRMLGSAGGDVPKEIQPNFDFHDRLMGFTSAVAEFYRQQQVSDLFTTTLNRGRTLSLTMENVRQKGHDLASNMSLYGYGYAHFAARRLNADLGAAFDVLQDSQLQRLLGVTNPYQVIEKTFTQRMGKSPDIVRLRTMAESGKAILDIVARNFNAWTSASGAPLFPDLSGGVVVGGLANNNQGPSSDISLDDTLKLIRNVQFFHAVNGIQDTQVDTYARPALKAYEPSIPTNSLSPGTQNGSGAAMDKIKQMVASGQTPSLDQLKSMLPSGFTN
ncbi:MAG TPA: hypothetical protein VLN48_04695 [Bryobacteraceae bacterium]|nr:hypothetical protein [Bryobacteraceae bacterium]